MQFTHEMRVAAQNHEKFTITPIFEVQDHSRSSMLTFLRSLPPVMISSTILGSVFNFIIPVQNFLSATIFTLDEPTAVE